MTGLGILLAAGFQMLTPSEAAELKIGEIVKPETAFVQFAEGFDAVMSGTVPTPNLLHTWRTLGVKVFARVDYDIDGSAEFFRKRCAFLPFMAGADGVVLTADPKTLPSGWQAAWEAAKEDARLSVRLRELGEKCRMSSDVRIVADGRRVGNWFGETDAVSEDVDTLRLETIALIKRLEILLKEKPGNYDLTLPKLEPGIVPHVPLQDRTLVRVKIDKVGSPVAIANGLTVSVANGGVSFTIKDPTTPHPGRYVFPKGKGGYCLRLWIPGRQKGDWLRYDVRAEGEVDDAPHADTSCLDGMAIGIEGRFGLRCGSETVTHVIPSRSWSEDYPHLNMETQWQPGLLKLNHPESGWTYTFYVSFSDMLGLWPMTGDVSKGIWYFELNRLPDGTGPVAGRIQFPRGDAGQRGKMAAAFDCYRKTCEWGRVGGLVDATWTSSAAEKRYPLAKTPTPHRFSAEEDELFCTRMLEPLLVRARKTAELVKRDRTTPAKFEKLLEGQKLDVVDSAGDMVYALSRASRLRRDFLLMRLKGEMPPEAKAVPESEKDAALKKPGSLAPADDDTISLDEEL